MNRLPVHTPVTDDKQAMRRVMWCVAKRSWMSLAFFPAVMTTGLRGELDQLFALIFVTINISASRSNLSQWALRMLPVSRRSLATTLWRFTAGYPIVLMAELSAINALYWTHAGDAWGNAWGRATLSFSWFLFIDAVPVAGAPLGIAWRETDSAQDEEQAKRIWSTRPDWREVLNLLSHGMFFGWIFVFSQSGGGPHTNILAFNLVVGGAGFVTSYFLRDRLVIEFAKSAAEKAQRTEFGPVWPTSGWGPWWLAWLKHLSGTAMCSACLGGVTALACITVTEFPRAYALPMDRLVGIIAGASVLNVSLAWIPWNIELRAWRMLPLSRAQLGATISGFMAAASILSWAVAFMAVGLAAVAKECLSFDELSSLLGMSIVIQGALLTILPSILRGSGRGVVLVIVSAGSAIYCVFYSATLLANIKQLTQSELTVHGAVWMTAGMVVLFAGMVISAWHAERVLRHGDCYRKAGE